MTSRRDALLACLDERIAGCRAAEDARRAVAAFVEGRTGMRGLDPDEVTSVHVGREDAPRLLLLSDLRAILDVLPDPALYLGLRAEVERHAPAALFDWCAGCRHDADGTPMYPADRCPFVARIAALLGVGGGVPS